MKIGIEAVIAEAQQRLEQTGRLDVAAFAAIYPEHAEELTEVLPVMLHLQQEKRWQRAESESRTFAVALFPDVAVAAATAAGPSTSTVGELFARGRAGLSEAEQSRLTGLPIQAIRDLASDPTPVERLDNAGIKQLAGRVCAPFAALLKEVRRLLSVESLSGMNAGTVFTRDQSTSTDAQKQALIDHVRRAASKPPEER